MKSAIFTLLPFAGVALAESACTLRTVTHTEYEKVYETAKEIEVKAKPTTCTRKTVTTTTYEKVYVTVTPDAIGDVTTTSTLDITTTITVHPSASYPTIGSQSIQPEYSLAYTPVPLSEVANPTSFYEAPAEASSVYEAPSKPSSVPEPEKEPEQVDDSAAAGSKRGEATFYGGNVSGGTCSFTGYTIPSGIFGTALSDSNWASASNCGACVQVTGPSGTKIKAMVVDQCPGCGPNHLDLFPDAFKKLADPSKGVIPVSWDIVPCGITSPIVLKNKEGTSKYWFSMQVMNSNIAVSKLEVSTDGGMSWKPTTRKDYNFFENPSGFGTDSVDVKVTSVNGGNIIVKGVSIAASSTKTAASNFS